jgi:hypothetical protein
LKTDQPIQTKDERDEERLLDKLSSQLKALFEEALSILQRFVQRYDLNKLADKIWQLYSDIHNNTEAKAFFKDLRQWSDSIVENPDSSENKDVVELGNKFLDRVNSVRKKFGSRILEVFEDVKVVLNSLKEERYLSAYQEDLQQIKDLTTTCSFLETVSRFKSLALPIIKEMMKEIKLPPLEIIDTFGTIRLQNLALMLNEVSIDDIVVKFKFGMKQMLKAMVKVKNIDIQFEDVEFVFERPTIFGTTITETGILDCRVTSRDWKMKMVLHQEPEKTSSFELVEVRGGIKRFDLSLVESDHEILASIMLGIISEQLKTRAQEALEILLKEHGEFLAQKMNELLFNSSSNNLSISACPFFQHVIPEEITLKAPKKEEEDDYLSSIR